MGSDLCMVPVVCESPALALAHRPRVQFAQGLPHDSATSLVRLDMHLLPSPLSKQVVLDNQFRSEEPHGSAAPQWSHDTPMCTPARSYGQVVSVSKGCQVAQGTHPVPMIISPDEHHADMQTQGKHSEEEFVLYSVPLIDSPGSDSAAESPGALSPESPADRSILPNSAPGFAISPSPVPYLGVLHNELASMSMHEQEGPASAAAEVDDVDALNLLLK